MGSTGPDSDEDLGSYATVSAMRLLSFTSAPGTSSAVAVMSCKTPTEKPVRPAKTVSTDRSVPIT